MGGETGGGTGEETGGETGGRTGGETGGETGGGTDGETGGETGGGRDGETGGETLRCSTSAGAATDSVLLSIPLTGSGFVLLSTSLAIEAKLGTGSTFSGSVSLSVN